MYGTTVNPLLPQSFVTSQSIKDFMPVPDEINQNYHSALSSRCLEQFVELVKDYFRYIFVAFFLFLIFHVYLCACFSFHIFLSFPRCP